MDNITEIEADAAITPEVAEVDIATQKRERERLRLRRKLATVKRRAQAQGFLEGVLSQLKTGDIVVECGANVGKVTRRLAETGATVYAFEPDPVAFEELEKRCAEFPNLCTINAAVGTAKGTATLHRSPLFAANPLKATNSSSLIADGQSTDEETSIEVPVFDLPTLLIDILAGRDPAGLPERLGVFRRPDALAFLMLDIEGSEYDVLNALHKADLVGQIRTTMLKTHEGKSRRLRRGLARLRQDLSESYAPSKVFADWV